MLLKGLNSDRVKMTKKKWKEIQDRAIQNVKKDNIK